MARHTNTMATSAMRTLVVALMLSSCAERESRPAETAVDKPVVYVVNYPLLYLTERIAGDEVEVHFPAPPDDDPAYWQPDAEQIAAYQSADLIVLNGASYEKWVAMASLPSSKMVDTSASFSDALIHIEEATTHSHGPTAAHTHTGIAFTTWLDFQQAIAQAQAIHDRLARLRPEKAEQLSANFSVLKNDLNELDAQMMTLAEKIGDEPLVVSHHVYQYWIRRYGLNVKAVMWEPEVVPDDEAMHDLKMLLADHPARLMIWNGAPDARSVRLLEAIGVQSVVFNPCGNVPDQGDFLSVMRQNIGHLDHVVETK